MPYLKIPFTLPSNIKIDGIVKNHVEINNMPTPVAMVDLSGGVLARAGRRKLKSLISEPFAGPEYNSKSHIIFNAVAMNAIFKPKVLSLLILILSILISFIQNSLFFS